MIGAELRRMRRSAGLSQTELAAKLGVGKSTVCQWQSGVRAVRFGDVERWAKACGFEVRFVPLEAGGTP